MYIMYLIDLIISKTKNADDNIRANHYKNIIPEIQFNHEDPITVILNIIDNKTYEKDFLTLLRTSSEFIETDKDITMRYYFILQGILLDIKDRLNEY